MSALLATAPATTMMKVGARLDETRTYLKRLDLSFDLKIQKTRAWEEQWFGFLAESMLDSVIYTLHQRFGLYPVHVQVLKDWSDRGLETHDFKLICHLHMQCTDLYYRWATGFYFHQRHEQGLRSVSALQLGKAFEAQYRSERSSQTYQRLARGVLSTARDVGLLKGKQEKVFAQPVVSLEFWGYLIYTLQAFQFPFAQLPASPFVQSLVKDHQHLTSLLRAGQRKGWWEFDWGQGLFSLSPRFFDLDAWYQGALK
jgi:hypothetical protein